MASSLLPIDNPAVALESSRQELRVIPPSWGRPLDERDYQALERSWISPEIIDAAMLRRVESLDGRELVGRKRGGNFAGLVIPYYLPDQLNPCTYRLRRDVPDFIIKAGRVTEEQKYLAAPQSKNRIFFPIGITSKELLDIQTPIAITEGEKKALALLRLADEGSPRRRFVPIAIAGVWNWRGVVSKTTGPTGERQDIKGPIPDLDLVTWVGRLVYVVFDADVHSNENVRHARNGLVRDLARRGAEVRLVNIPETAKAKGIDDLLGAWGPERVLELFEQAKSGAKLEVVDTPQYREEGGELFRLTTSGNSLKKVRLTNYSAVIEANVLLDDGVETHREFEIAAEFKGRRFRETVSAAEFQTMDWPMKVLGGSAITYPGFREHARTAIQELSQAAKERTIYSHTGWRDIEGVKTYLHGLGGISSAGATSNLEIRLSGQMRFYELRLPADRDSLIEAVQANLSLLDLAPDIVSFPLLSATYRSTFGNADFAVHLSGETGTFKSELAALHQQHFGPRMTRTALPASWESTPNSLQVMTFLAKDALFVIDDFAPQGGHNKVGSYHSAAERVFRSAGNHAGRGRLDSAATLRESKPPRALILSTGEDVPLGHSIRARLLILEMSKNTIEPHALTWHQQNAAAGRYATAMGAFVHHVSGDYDGLQARLQQKIAAFSGRDFANTVHARTPMILANLNAAFELYVEFAISVEAIDSNEAKTLRERCHAALIAVGQAQRSHQLVAKPAERFLEILRSLLSSGGLHFESNEGAVPGESPRMWGWVFKGEEWQPLGSCVGWVIDGNVFLDFTAALKAVQVMGRDLGEGVSVTDHTLKKRLHEGKFLQSVDQSRETLTVRRKICGVSKNVLHLVRDAIAPEISDVGANAS